MIGSWGHSWDHFCDIIYHLQVLLISCLKWSSNVIHTTIIFCPYSKYQGFQQDRYKSEWIFPCDSFYFPYSSIPLYLFIIIKKQQIRDKEIKWGQQYLLFQFFSNSLSLHSIAFNKSKKTWRKKKKKIRNT